jgi:hypothetical protein
MKVTFMSSPPVLSFHYPIPKIKKEKGLARLEKNTSWAKKKNLKSTVATADVGDGDDGCGG